MHNSHKAIAALYKIAKTHTHTTQRHTITKCWHEIGLSAVAKAIKLNGDNNMRSIRYNRIH